MQQLYSHRVSQNQMPSLPSADHFGVHYFAQFGVEEGAVLHLTDLDDTLIKRLQLWRCICGRNCEKVCYLSAEGHVIFAWQASPFTGPANAQTQLQSSIHSCCGSNQPSARLYWFLSSSGWQVLLFCQSRVVAICQCLPCLCTTWNRACFWSSDIWNHVQFHHKKHKFDWWELCKKAGPFCIINVI